MKKTLITLCIASVSTIASAGTGTQWGYSGHSGPENWAQLSADNFACSGSNQSPVNLTGFIEADLTPIEFNYKSGGHEVFNNGHTIQVNYSPGSRINIDEQAFELKQFHFHAPSENHINGSSFPLEAHYVHANDQGQLVVVAVMFKEGKENKPLKGAWLGMPKVAGEKASYASSFNANKLLPDNKDYYRFNGSLTTPPCSEGVRWLVLKDSLEASREQISHFTDVIGFANNRPLQPINARTILQ